MERAGALLAAAPVRGDAEVQGDQGGCEPDRDQQASETDPGASAASQGDYQAADYRDQQADFCGSSRGRIVERRREHRAGSSPFTTVSASSPPTGKEIRHRLEPAKAASLSVSRFGGTATRSIYRTTLRNLRLGDERQRCGHRRSATRSVDRPPRCDPNAANVGRSSCSATASLVQSGADSVSSVEQSHLGPVMRRWQEPHQRRRYLDSTRCLATPICTISAPIPIVTTPGRTR